MVKALFDTNILVDYLNGHGEARAEIALYDDPAISIVTWMEVLVGATNQTEARTRAFLSTFRLLAIDGAIAEEAVCRRRLHRLRLPDALIWASAITTGRLLVTRNLRGFPANDPGVREPYRL